MPSELPESQIDLSKSMEFLPMDDFAAFDITLFDSEALTGLD